MHMATTRTGKGASGELPIELLQLKKAAFLLRANHCLRLDLLRHLHRRGECCVSELYLAFTLEQSVASQHLAILRRAGIVTKRRAGKQIFYSINYRRLEEIQSLAGSLLP